MVQPVHYCVVLVVLMTGMDFIVDTYLIASRARSAMRQYR